MPVMLGQNNMSIKPGHIYISPGDHHMLIDSNLTITLDDGPKENFVRPSADPMFRSIANTFNERSVAIVLTGLGRDGSNGSQVIKKINGKVIIQDPTTAIAPSMPRSVLDEGIADVNTTVDQIPRKIAEFIKKLV